MPAIADEAGTKLFNLLEMFGRELIRNEIHKNTQLREEAGRAKKTAKDLSNAGQGLFGKGARASQAYTQTWFKSHEGAQATLRELKQLSPKLFANSTVIGHFIIHPKNKVITDAIEDISRDHRLVTYAMNLDALDRDKSKSAYLKSQPDGNCTRFSFGEFGDEGASFNAAYYCSVLQDYDINARHIGNQVILDNADCERAIEALNLEKRKVEAMGPERGEMFMRQRFMDRIGVEYEPPLIGGEAEGYEGAGGDLSVEAPAPDPQHVHVDTDAEDRESGEDGFYVPSLDDVDEARDGDGAGSSPADGKTGPESTEEIAEEELAEKTVESSPAPDPKATWLPTMRTRCCPARPVRRSCMRTSPTARPRRIACRRVPMRITATSQPPMPTDRTRPVPGTPMGTASAMQPRTAMVTEPQTAMTKMPSISTTTPTTSPSA